MSSDTKRSHLGYHSEPISPKMSAITALLSVILALILLQKRPIMLLSYFVLTCVIATVMTTLRTWLYQMRTPKPQEKTLLNTKTYGWRQLLLVILILITLFALPLALARVLDPYVWFVLLISFAAGLSFSEVISWLFYKLRA